jgi:hypothetical protein
MEIPLDLSKQRASRGKREPAEGKQRKQSQQRASRGQAEGKQRAGREQGDSKGADTIYQKTDAIMVLPLFVFCLLPAVCSVCSPAV